MENANGNAQGGRSSAKRRVLVIEDNVDAAESLREVLEFGGHTVQLANNGGDGIAKSLSFRPDMILCDIGLPGLDGYEVARRLRAEKTLASVYLVALTGYALPEDLAKAKAAGFDEHIAKPASLERLEQILASALAPGSAR
jgi:CheY-like chemotaxis protein